MIEEKYEHHTPLYRQKLKFKDYQGDFLSDAYVGYNELLKSPNQACGLLGPRAGGILSRLKDTDAKSATEILTLIAWVI